MDARRAELFGHLEKTHPLIVDGGLGGNQPGCFETFPHAILCIEGRNRLGKA